MPATKQTKQTTPKQTTPKATKPKQPRKQQPKQTTPKRSEQSFRSQVLAGLKRRATDAVASFVQSGTAVGEVGLDARAAFVEQYGESKQTAARFVTWFENVTGLSSKQLYHLMAAARAFRALPARSPARQWKSDQLAALAPLAGDPRKLAAAVKAAGKQPNRAAVQTAVSKQQTAKQQKRRRAASTKATAAADASIMRKHKQRIATAMSKPDADRDSIVLGVVIGALMAGKPTKAAQRFGTLAGKLADEWIAEQS